jgi:uncharacterized membrane protein YdbT with pleckstrin-like domain
MAGFHISRWRYGWGYIVVFSLVIIAIWFTDHGGDTASYIAGGLALVLFFLLEILVRMERLVISDSGIKLRKGFLSKNVTRVAYSTISNVSVSQSVFQRLLRYGDIEIDTPGGPTAEIVLLKFQDAGKIERLISSYIHEAHAKHTHHSGPHVGP